MDRLCELQSLDTSRQHSCHIGTVNRSEPTDPAAFEERRSCGSESDRNEQTAFELAENKVQQTITHHTLRTSHSLKMKIEQESDPSLSETAKRKASVRLQCKQERQRYNHANSQFFRTFFSLFIIPTISAFSPPLTGSNLNSRACVRSSHPGEDSNHNQMHTHRTSLLHGTQPCFSGDYRAVPSFSRSTRTRGGTLSAIHPCPPQLYRHRYRAQQHCRQVSFAPPLLQLLAHFSSPEEEGEDNEDGNDSINEEYTNRESDSFYNLLSSDDNNLATPRMSPRERVKKFLGSRGGNSSRNVVQPISLDGNMDDSQQQEEKESEVVQTNFEGIFQGMPGLGDIIGTANDANPPKQPETKKNSPANPYDDEIWINAMKADSASASKKKNSLSPEDVSVINANFEKFKEDMRSKLEKLRNQDPDSVPDNAEFILDQVVEEQRELDMRNKIEEREMQSFGEYEKRMKEKLVDALDGSVDRGGAVVQEILEQIKENNDRKEAQEELYNDFAEYERSLKERHANRQKEIIKDAIQSTPTNSGDFDEKQLQLLEELLTKRKTSAEENGFEDEDIYLTDNIEDGIKELQAKIAANKNNAESLTKPETLKEWQMYRAIATRLVKQEKEREGLENDDYGDYEIEEDVDAIAKQLQSWKEFQEKEEEMRRKAGLTIKTRMPFEWSDKPDDYTIETRKPSTGPIDKVKAEEARSDMDNTAIGILNDLMWKTEDPKRRLKLQREIEELKADIQTRKETLEKEAANSIDDEAKRSKLAEPMKMSDLLKPNKSTMNIVRPEETSTEQFNLDASSDNMDDLFANKPPSKPNSPFFSMDNKGEEPLQSAFKKSGESGIEDDSYIDSDNNAPSLGSLKEQKFRSLVARSGVRTVEEQEELRRKWEEFQEAEQAMRDKTGLSGMGDDQDTEQSPTASTPNKMDYDLTEVLKEGGDVDAERILASIGQRPSRKNKGDSDKGNLTNLGGEKVVDTNVENRIEEDTDDSSTARNAPSSPDTKEEKKETVDKKRDRNSSYEEFMKYQEQMNAEMMQKQKQSSQNQSNPNFSGSATIANSDMVEDSSGDKKEKNEDEDVIIYHKQATQWDDSSYSDQMYRSYAAASGGNRGNEPGQKERNKEAFQEYLKQEEEMRRKIEEMSSSGESDLDKGKDIDIEEYADTILSSLGPRPKSQKAKKDDEPDSSREYGGGLDIETGNKETSRKIPAKTSMRRKNTRPKSSILSEQMPDWLRREMEEVRGEEFQLSDDESDDDFYVSDDLEEDYEEKQRQAEEFERKVSKAPKEVNIGDLFGRDYFGPDDYGEYDSQRMRQSDDFSSFVKRKANLMEYTVLSVAEVDALMEHKRSSIETGVSPYMSKINKPFSEFGAIFRLEGVIVDTTGLQMEAWKRTAEDHGFKAPTIDDVKFAAVHKEDFSIQRLFYWTDDIFTCRKIAKTFREKRSEVFNSWMEENCISILEELDDSSETKLQNSMNMNLDESQNLHIKESSVNNPSEADAIQIQFRAWEKVAQKYDFPAPAMYTVQLAKIFTPDEAVRASFRWTSDTLQSIDVAESYRSILREETNKWMKENNAEFISPVKTSPESSNFPDSLAGKDTESQNKSSFTESDMLEIQLYGWNAAAEKYGFDSPSIEEVQLATWVSAEKAVKDVFKWTSDERVAQEILSAYREARREVSAKFMKKFNLDEDLISGPEKTNGKRHQTKSDIVKPSLPSEQDVMLLNLKAWESTADTYQYSEPSVDQVLAAMFVGPSKAINSVFKWTNEKEETDLIVSTFRDKLKDLSSEWAEKMDVGSSLECGKATDEEESMPLFELKEEFKSFFESLQEVKMPSAVISYLDNDQLTILLQHFGLSKFFPPDKRVSATNGYASEAQQMLGAALRVERRPDHCIEFDATPQSAISAHEVGMKNVAMVRPYPYYELTTADMSARYFDNISTVNLRNLFSEVTNEPMQQVQVEGPQTKIRLLQKTRFFEEGDR